jgi:hypothetical protein
VVAEPAGFVDEWAGIDPAELSDAALASTVLALRARMDRLEAEFARLVDAAHQRGVGAADGAASTSAWLRWQAGMREGEARAAIEAGSVCREVLTETGVAWRAGAITAGAARSIIAARVEGHDDDLQAVEPALLDLARRRDFQNLRRACTHVRKCALADGTDPGARNGLHLSRTYDGVTALSGELEDLGAETVLTAVHAYTDPPSDDDTRTTAQRRAAALVRICEVALAHLGEDGRHTTHVSVVLDWKTLNGDPHGRHDGAFTGPIHPADIDRLLCDCEISRVVTGPDGLPLDVGRSRRNPTPAIRRAVVVRDGGCRFPGCDRPPGWSQTHHVRRWTDFGPTALSNLVLLCDRHHHVVHQPGWVLRFDGRDLTVVRPDGTELCERPRARAVHADPPDLEGASR